MASSSIVGLMALQDLITTVLPKSDIVLDAVAQSVRAFGGDFGLTDYNGRSIPGVLTIELQDGTSISRAIGSSPIFVGVISAEESLASLQIGATSNGPLVTVQSMIIAGIPAPGGLAVFLLVPLVLSRPRHARRA